MKKYCPLFVLSYLFFTTESISCSNYEISSTPHAKNMHRRSNFFQYFFPQESQLASEACSTPRSSEDPLDEKVHDAPCSNKDELDEKVHDTPHARIMKRKLHTIKVPAEKSQNAYIDCENSTTKAVYNINLSSLCINKRVRFAEPIVSQHIIIESTIIEENL